MNENRCIVMWRGIPYLVVRTLVPPTNNTLLILVPPTPERALEIITIMNTDEMEENECTFMPKYNEIAEQLLKMEVIEKTEKTLEGMPLSELLMNEDNTQLVPIYKINLNRVEIVPELAEHLPEDLLKKYAECCKIKKHLNEIAHFNGNNSSLIEQGVETENEELTEAFDDEFAESNRFSQDAPVTESNRFSQDTTNTGSEGNNSRELNPTLTWEVLAKKIARTQYGW